MPFLPPRVSAANGPGVRRPGLRGRRLLGRRPAWVAAAPAAGLRQGCERGLAVCDPLAEAHEGLLQGVELTLCPSIELLDGKAGFPQETPRRGSFLLGVGPLQWG